VGGRFETLVLEPSPPAVNGPPWFADDPTDLQALVNAESKVVSPVTNADLTWNELCQTEAELSGWCAERWLGAWRALMPLPAGFGETRSSLHCVAEHVLAPARHHANGKIGLRYTRRGFGTPFFGDDVQIRVEGADIIVERDEREERFAIGSIADAAQAVGIAPGAPTAVYHPSTSPDVNQELALDEAAALALGEWFGFGASVLEQLRWDLRAAVPSRLQLWPEHFDLATELGDERSGSRAVYGASPGDQNHPAPYLYVAPWYAAPWSPPGAEPPWNDNHFHGASLGYDELLEAPDQRSRALDFFHRCFAELDMPRS
jgi:hypothetical protein